MFNFSEEMITTLTAAGWFPTRQVDITEWLAEITACDYFISPLAIELLSTFGGLRITALSDETNRFRPPFIFDPTKKLYFDVEEYEPMIGERLTPFAVDEEDTGFFITPSGGLYGIHENHFVCYGRSMPESLENRVMGRRAGELIHEDKS
ncbi:MAG: SUKH-3 domain-containing protein [Gemmataceae bacterium]